MLIPSFFRSLGAPIWVGMQGSWPVVFLRDRELATLNSLFREQNTVSEITQISPPTCQFPPKELLPRYFPCLENSLEAAHQAVSLEWACHQATRTIDSSCLQPSEALAPLTEGKGTGEMRIEEGAPENPEKPTWAQLSLWSLPYLEFQ